MSSRVRNSPSGVRHAGWCLLAIVLAACSASSSVTDSGESGDAHTHPPAIALVDRPDGQPTIEVLEPVDGAIVTSPLRMTVNTSGLAFAAPGSPVDGEGHWHVLLDGCLPAGAFIPENAQSIHVDSGRDASDIDLPPGTHDLCIQIGDGFHVAVNVYDTITLTVVEE